MIADANGGWGVQDAVVAARAMEDLERFFFEQPLDRTNRLLQEQNELLRRRNKDR